MPRTLARGARRGSGIGEARTPRDVIWCGRPTVDRSCATPRGAAGDPDWRRLHTTFLESCVAQAANPRGGLGPSWTIGETPGDDPRGRRCALERWFDARAAQ